MQVNELTEQIIGAAIDVHRVLGPGLLESAYESCLCLELSQRDIRFQRQVEMPLEYKGSTVDCGFRFDLLVEGLVIMELKAVDRVLPIHEAQLMSYLRLSKLKTGLLINFNVTRLVDGITRRVL
ncbi:MAG: GxxExxY protein [Planctomycetota bacterium]